MLWQKMLWDCRESLHYNTKFLPNQNRHSNKGCGHKWWWIAAMVLFKQQTISFVHQYAILHSLMDKNIRAMYTLAYCSNAGINWCLIQEKGGRCQKTRQIVCQKNMMVKFSHLINKTQIFCKISSHGIKCPIHSSGQACSKQNDIPWTGTTTCY